MLAELYRQGVLGGQVARGANEIDILTSTGPTIQVKAKQPNGRWMLWHPGHAPNVEFVVMVAVGTRHQDDEFFVVPVKDLDEYAGARSAAYRAYKTSKDPSWSSGDDKYQLRQEETRFPVDGKLPAEFLKPYQDCWRPVLHPVARGSESGNA